MRRREFVAWLAGAAAISPSSAWGQQPPVPAIGFLHARSPDGAASQIAAFRQGLAEHGYVEPQSISVEYRYAHGQYDTLPALAADLVRHQVAVLVTGAGELSASAAKATTSLIPIVFVIGSDPVKAGFVMSYNRPGGNATGMNIGTEVLGAKRLGLLHELVPEAAIIGIVLNPNSPTAQSQFGDVQEAGRAIGVQVRALPATTESEIESAFKALEQQHVRALLVAADPFLDTQRDKLVALAALHTIPTMFQFREHAVAGGLMSYGIDFAEVYRQVGSYVGRILKGERPGDLPIIHATKSELVINLKTAKALGLTIPPSLLARADEVIE